MWTRLSHGLSVGCLYAILATAAFAEDRQVSSTGPAIGLDRAIVLALERNPSLVSAGYQIKIEEARLLQAGLAPNPELGISAENFAGAGRFSELESAEFTISLDWVLERGKRSK
ncbi:MAG: TolC family protein, partial [Gammaproteobacteria bacterium]|nr:TolC family protein [Gammaproteobacteria bacterium]